MKARNKRFWILMVAYLVGAGIDHLPDIHWYEAAIIAIPLFVLMEIICRQEIFWT